MNVDTYVPSEYTESCDLRPCKGCGSSERHQESAIISFECFLFNKLRTERELERSFIMDFAMLKKHRSTLDERFICLATELAMLESPSMDTAIIGRSRYHVQDEVSECPAPSSTLKGAIADKEILYLQSQVNILSIQRSMIRLEKGKDPDDDPLWHDYVSGKARHEMTVLSDEGGSQKKGQSLQLMDEDALPSAQDEFSGQSTMQRKFGGQHIIQSDDASFRSAEGCVASIEEDYSSFSSQRSSTSHKQSPYELPQLPASGSASRISPGIARPSSRRTLAQPPIMFGPARNTRGNSSRYKPYESR